MGKSVWKKIKFWKNRKDRDDSNLSREDEAESNNVSFEDTSNNSVSTPISSQRSRRGIIKDYSTHDIYTFAHQHLIFSELQSVL